MSIWFFGTWCFFQPAIFPASVLPASPDIPASQLDHPAIACHILAFCILKIGFAPTHHSQRILGEALGSIFTLQQPFPQKEVKVSIQPCLPVAAIPMLLSLFCCVAKIYRICMGQVFVCSSDGGFHCEHFGTDSTLPFSYLPWSD